MATSGNPSGENASIAQRRGQSNPAPPMKPAITNWWYTRENGRIGGPPLQPLPLRNIPASNEVTQWFEDSKEQFEYIAKSLNIKCNPIFITRRVPRDATDEEITEKNLGNETIMVEAYLHPDRHVSWIKFVDQALRNAAHQDWEDLHVEIILTKPTVTEIESAPTLWMKWVAMKQIIEAVFAEANLGNHLKSMRLGRLSLGQSRPAVIVVAVDEALTENPWVHEECEISDRISQVKVDLMQGFYKQDRADIDELDVVFELE